MKIYSNLSMLSLIVASNCCLCLDVYKYDAARAEMKEALKNQNSPIHVLKSLRIRNGQKFNFCNLSWQQAFYLCLLIFKKDQYGLNMGSESPSHKTCDKTHLQLDQIVDPEKNPINFKLKMYSCPTTSDGAFYYLTPIDEQIPTLAVIRYNQFNNKWFVDAKVTDINQDRLAEVKKMDLQQIKNEMKNKLPGEE